MTDLTLFEAILALDSYNQGYNPQVFGGGTQIGSAQRTDLSDQLPSSAAVQAGFDAVAYQIAGGPLVISYRGTDNISGGTGNGDIPNGSDLWNGWTIGAGYSAASTAGLPIEFYQDVTQESVYDTPLPSNMILVGHSLGGGLAGFVAALSGVTGVGFDYMPFGIASWLQAAADAYLETGRIPLSPSDLQAAGVNVPSNLSFSAVNVDGEPLQYVRDGLVQSLVTALLGTVVGGTGGQSLAGFLTGLTETIDADKHRWKTPRMALLNLLRLQINRRKLLSTAAISPIAPVMFSMQVVINLRSPIFLRARTVPGNNLAVLFSTAIPWSAAALPSRISRFLMAPTMETLSLAKPISRTSISATAITLCRTCREVFCQEMTPSVPRGIG